VPSGQQFDLDVLEGSKRELIRELMVVRVVTRRVIGFVVALFW
jgi:hypothetical protein